MDPVSPQAEQLEIHFLQFYIISKDATPRNWLRLLHLGLKNLVNTLKMDCISFENNLASELCFEFIRNVFSNCFMIKLSLNLRTKKELSWGSSLEPHFLLEADKLKGRKILIFCPKSSLEQIRFVRQLAFHASEQRTRLI